MSEKTPPNIQSLRKAKPKCNSCGRSVATGPRTVIRGGWMCPDCTYELEYGEPVRKKRPKAKAQEERLFPLPEPVSDVSKRA